MSISRIEPASAAGRRGGRAIAKSAGASRRQRHRDRATSTCSATVNVRSTGHTGVTVSDLDRSITFYRDLLGCEVSQPVRAEGPFFEAITGVPGCQIDIAFVRLPGHIMELLCYRHPAGRVSTLRPCDPGFVHVCLKVSDLDRVVGLVRGAGLEPAGAVQEVTHGPLSGIKCVYVRDPDGFVLELIEEPGGVCLEDFHFG
jgi:catechol 2,3-dioxygenase-like lactoylglutathione lyase family enzyme